MAHQFLGVARDAALPHPQEHTASSLGPTAAQAFVLSSRKPWNNLHLRQRHSCSRAGHSAATPLEVASPPAGRQDHARGGRNDDNGLSFIYEHPKNKLSFRTWHQRRMQALEAGGGKVQAKVDVLVEGQPLRASMNSAQLQALLQEVGADAGQVVQQALALKAQRQPRYKLPRLAVLSLVACDDVRMSVLNAQHRGKEGPTDVLSFEMDDELDHKVRLPVKLLGDMVISLDTAQRQARERRHSLRDEVRILLVHGMLHLCGYDHEVDDEQHNEMALAEQHIMAQLGWQGQGLILAATSPADSAKPSAKALHEGPRRVQRLGGDGFGAKPPPPQQQQLQPVWQPHSSRQLAAAPTQQQQLNGQGGTVAAGGGAGALRHTPWRFAATGAPATTAQGCGVAPGVSGRPSAAATLGVLGAVFGAVDEIAVDEANASGESAHGPLQAGAPGSKSTPAIERRDEWRACARQPDSSTGPSSSLSSSPSLGSQSGARPARGTGSAAARSAGLPGGGPVASVPSTAAPLVSAGSPGASPVARSAPAAHARRDIRLVALDMDGTLLDSASRVRHSTAAAVRAALGTGVAVILATGKARPAAIAACEAAGLAGPGQLVHPGGPGIFLQGLAVYGQRGEQLTDAQLPPSVVERCFRYVQERHPDGRVSLVAFLGDQCSTLQMTDDVQTLHHLYYEPLASVVPSLEQLLVGPPVRKLLFMTKRQVVDGELKPYWIPALRGSGAATLQAVSTMLEVVPEGVDKWVGAQVLLRHLGLSRSQFMAVGDGGNDLEMVRNAGVGVAMGNAVPAVKDVATAVVASHDEDGIAQAFERFVL